MRELPLLLPLVLAFVAGIGLGVFFFAGLWWTVRHCLSSTRPALWIIGSVLVRTAVLLAGFYWVSGGRWQPLLACTLGFITARLVVISRVLPAKDVIPRTRMHAPEP